jgi:GNAT superfamily N-acetyltransferase
LSDLVIREAVSPAERRAFVDLLWQVYRDDPAWVPPLKMERLDLITPSKNPYFEHATAKLWLAYRGERLVGRISAQIDQLVLQHMGAGTGQWGCLEVDNDPAAAAALLTTAEAWLKSQGMTRALGPFSLSVWDEPGLLVDGFHIPPLIMTGHHRPAYAGYIEAAGHAKVRDLLAYELDITKSFPDKIQRIVAMGDANPKIRIRPVDMANFNSEVELLLGILNDAWSDNWGFIPMTPAEIAHAAKGLKPLVNPQMIRVAEYDGEPVAFMLTLPDLNHFIRDLNGSLVPFGWAKLLYRLKFGRSPKVRVPLMGVKKEHQSKRHGGFMVMMLIEHIRHYTHGTWGASVGELSWILEDNLPMRNILEQIGCFVTKTYRIYEKTL